jgi:hypothetical protein
MEGHRSSKSICVGSSPTIPAKPGFVAPTGRAPVLQSGGCGFKSRQIHLGTIAQLVERSPCKREVRGSRPLGSTVTEPKVVAGLVCETSISEFNSRRSPQMEATVNGLATRFENESAAML